MCHYDSTRPKRHPPNAVIVTRAVGPVGATKGRSPAKALITDVRGSKEKKGPDRDQRNNQNQSSNSYRRLHTCGRRKPASLSILGGFGGSGHAVNLDQR